MKNILEEIVSVKKEEVKLLKRDYSLSRFKDSEFFGKKRLSIIEGIKNDNNLSIIAEIKKASPSKGVIRENFNHMEIADIYLSNEVCAVSVLTDRNFFEGSIKFLRDIAAIKSAPLLRKDFIIDEYQIYEAKSNGADFILLISEILSGNQIKELTVAARETDLDVLLELHSEDQLNKIDLMFNNLLGVNNRDLKDFSLDIKTTLALAEKLDGKALVISESGISSEDEIKILKDAPVSGILVGEFLMKQNSINNGLKQLKDWCYREG